MMGIELNSGVFEAPIRRNFHSHECVVVCTSTCWNRHRLAPDRVPGYLSTLLKDIRARDRGANARILRLLSFQLSCKAIRLLRLS
jgi:hypothetical protein